MKLDFTFLVSSINFGIDAIFLSIMAILQCQGKQTIGYLSSFALSKAWPFGGRGIHDFAGLSHSGFHSMNEHKTSLVHTTLNSVDGSLLQTLLSNTSNSSCGQLWFSPNAFNQLWLDRISNHIQLIILAHRRTPK